MTDLTQKVEGVTLSKVCKVREDKESDEVKTITLRVKFDGVTLQDVFAKALSGAVIQWQNGPGRNKFTTWEDNQIVEVNFSAPGRTTVDPKMSVLAEAKAAGVDIEDIDALGEFVKEWLRK